MFGPFHQPPRPPLDRIKQISQVRRRNRTVLEVACLHKGRRERIGGSLWEQISSSGVQTPGHWSPPRGRQEQCCVHGNHTGPRLPPGLPGNASFLQPCLTQEATSAVPLPRDHARAYTYTHVHTRTYTYTHTCTHGIQRLCKGCSTFGST